MSTAQKIEIQDTGTPAIVRFWAAAYRRFERPLAEGLGFHVPEFPVPLLSPLFVTGDRKRFLERNGGLIDWFNEIVPLGHDQRGPAPSGFRLDKQFFLGERRLVRRDPAGGFTARVLPLREALEGKAFPRLIEDGFPRDAPFLRALLPFLTTLDAEFRTVILEENGKAVGAVTVGVANDAALVLNAVVAVSERGRGISAVLIDEAQNVALDLGASHAFFLAEDPFLGRHADRIRHYRIFSRRTV